MGVTTDHLIDWGRKPVSPLEQHLVDSAIDLSLEFLRSMVDVKPRYEADADVQRYRDLATPVVLAALDAFRRGTRAVAERSDEANRWLAERNADWLIADNAVHAIAHVGMLRLERIDQPEGHACRYELSGDALEIAQREFGMPLGLDPRPRFNLDAILQAAQPEAPANVEQTNPRDNDLDHSRPLDVHTWSDHPEVNAFVDQIYEAHFKGGNADIRKRHLKVVLLDLYVAWTHDPTLKIAYSRNVNQYEPGSRYNALHISKMTPTVVDHLIEAGLVNHVKGFQDRRDGGSGRMSRMWPTERLVEMFKDAKFSPLDIGGYENRECIILRDEAGSEIEYEDTPETERMRAVLRDYNSLLRETFIDIPTLEEPFIESKPDRSGRVHKLQINQRDKFVRRVFNRGAWDKGGRFWGGWWQRCPKKWRPHIFIDDKATSEVDYSGLHIVMLYAQQKIDYWTEVGEDPYRIDTPTFLETEDQTRSVAKQLLLTALNAKDDKSAFGAFRQDAPAGSREKHLKDIQLGHVLDKLRERHKPIAGSMASDAGIDLMNLDARITERLIEDFTHDGIPILSIHDSYIVPHDLVEELQGHMQKIFEEVMDIPGIRVKDEAFHPERWEPMSFEDAAIVDPVAWAESMKSRFDPPRSERYKCHLESFRTHFGSEKE